MGDPLATASGQRAVVGESVGYWLCQEDFVSTDDSSVLDLGPLGFPRDWPAVYSSSRALKSLVGKKGRCAATQLAVVAAPESEQLQLVEGLRLVPLQSFANAERCSEATKAQLSLRCGWAIYERLDQAPSMNFVAERYWWNAMPDGRWVDFTPRPQGCSQLLLALAVDGAPKLSSCLSAEHEAIVEALYERRFGLKEQLALAVREADEACSTLRRLEAEAEQLREQLHGARQPVSWKTPPVEADLRAGCLARVHGLREAADLNDQEVTLEHWDARRSRWKVRLRSGELRAMLPTNLEVLDEAKDRPHLTTFGCELLGCLPGEVQYHLWPLVHSGLVRVRLPDRLLVRLNAQFDRLYAERHSSTPSHALYLQGEMKEGQQLTVLRPDEEYKSVLLACAEKLADAILGETAADFKHVLDTVWTVHQLAGDYNPVHFHNNVQSHFGFSSFLHLQLPPQLSSAQGRLPKTGAKGRHDGVTSFIWRTDSGLLRDTLECPGTLECELQEGYLYVFPQWVQHYVWPFQGPGERRTVAANVALLGPWSHQ